MNKVIGFAWVVQRKRLLAATPLTNSIPTLPYIRIYRTVLQYAVARRVRPTRGLLTYLNGRALFAYTYSFIRRTSAVYFGTPFATNIDRSGLGFPPSKNSR